MSARRANTVISVIVLLALLVQPLASGAAAPVPAEPVAPTHAVDPQHPGFLFRTFVMLAGSRNLARLEKTGVLVLDSVDRDGAQTALVLADGEQLADLARLGFRPQAADELRLLVNAQGSEKQWLAEGLAPLLAQADALAEQSSLAGEAGVAAAPDAAAEAAALQGLRTSLQALTPEQLAGVAGSISVDDDLDGLTNTEEQWWCTNPLNSNTDADAAGFTDGQEVTALLDFTLSRTVRWNYGPPFGPPSAWPDFNGADGNPATAACNDGDFDTIPDYAEAYMVGTRVGTGDSENTDGDKFDDGQELFGITYCPGGSTYCGYGNYPRTQDYSFITSGMPSWIRPPGDSPFVAAYPVIDFLVDPATVKVTAKEIRTIDRTITQGEEISTGFAETQGNSTSIGTIDTNTHSTWQENSTTEGGIEPTGILAYMPNSVREIPADTPSMPTSAGPQPPQKQSGICWGGSGSQAQADDLTELQQSVCQGLLASVSSGQVMAVTDNHLTLPPDRELLVSRVAEFVSQADGQKYVWVEGSVRPKARTGLGLYAEMYAILESRGANLEIYFAGSRMFKELLHTIPDSIAPQQLKESLAPWTDPQPQPAGTHFYLPWTKGVALNVYTQAPHGGTWAWDFQTDSSGTLLRATRSGRVYAYDGHTGYGCTDYYKPRANWVLIDHGDGTASLYLHIKAGGALLGKGSGWGQWVDQGTPVAVSGNTGYSIPCSDGVHHLHFQVQKWNGPPTWNSGEQYYNGVFNYDSYKVRFEEYPDTDTLPSPATSQNQLAASAGLVCSGPGFKSTDPQPSTLPATRKRTWFEEIIGRLFKGWKGTNTSGSWVTAAAAASTTALPGCSGSSCSSQVGLQNSIPYNFSDSRSDGQCGGNGYSGGDSPAGAGGGGAGLAFNDNGDGTWDRLRVWSETHTTGEGWSTSHSELRSQTEYSEITRSESNTLVSSEAWSTATTTDPTDAGQLTFNYNLYNTGSDAAVNLTGLRINVLIGDLPVITWNAPDRSDILPGQAKGPFSSDPLTLTLDQLAAIDNGAPIRVVLADYGYDDNLYDANAWGRSVLFHVDDGTTDGDETVDTYLITTNLVQGETYQDTLARYFDVTTFEGATGDERNGTITGIRTPEFAGNGEITGWNEHSVNEHGWWELSISVGGETAGVNHFKEMPAKPKTDVYLRYVVDTDADGYTDRAERDAGTDPLDPDSHPRPLLAVAQHTSVTGGTATVQVSLQNAGNFDASSVELWAVAPDDSITINDNLVGGGGRVRAGSQVILGARIGAPDLAGWTTSTAKPYPDGQFEGTNAKTYAFRADATGNIGTTAGLAISWSGNGGGTWTPLAVGSGYTAWAPLSLADGLTIAFSAGYVSQGETFNFQTALPIDTFSYTINNTIYSKPLIIASYNDPEGNHKFISGVELAHIQDDLTPYLGQMRYGFQMDVMSEEMFSPGANTAYIVFNNPSDTTISGGNLFVEFAKPDGTVVKEYVLSGQTFDPGPNVATLSWNTADFTPAFDPAQEYHILAFAADRQGTIFENTVKSLAQVGKDRLPLAVLPDSVWNFGTAPQGTLLRRTIAVANTGYNDLLAFVESTPGLYLSTQGSIEIQAADLAFYDLTLRTQELSVGPFARQVSIRTSDPAHPSHTFTITGTITAMPADTPVGTMQRPLDWPATVSGSLGDWVEFTHTLGPEPQTLHPVKVYSQDYASLKGVGKYATSFGSGTLPFDVFGIGRDGDKTVSGTENLNTFTSCSGTSGSTALLVSSTSGFGAGDMVLIHQSRGINSSNWEINTVSSVGSGFLTTASPLRRTYTDDGGVTGGPNQTQCARIPQYRSLTINGTVTPPDFDEPGTGGILAVAVTGQMIVNGSINVDGEKGRSHYQGANDPKKGGGYWGGWVAQSNANDKLAGIQGMGWYYWSGAPWGYGMGQVIHAAGNGAGGSNWDYDASGGGNGTGGQWAPNSAGGSSAGNETLTTMLFGGGGGGCGAVHGNDDGGGGSGGGIVVIFARNLSVAGTISANGGDGGNGNHEAGGGGAGGSILITAQTASLGSNRVTARGGAAGSRSGGQAGAGGVGRVYIEYQSISGDTDPPAVVQPRAFYIVEQIESSPYDRSRLNLPESGTHTYQVQYGRKLDFGAAGEITTTLRIPATANLTATLDALVSGVGTGSATFKLDIGNDGGGTWDWETTRSITDSATLTNTGLAAAFNTYWAAHGAPLSGSMDVPVKVYLSKAGQVLVTNLQVTPTGSKLRHIRLPVEPQGYSSVTAGFTASGGSGQLAVGVDIGDDGSVDWTYSGSPTYPVSLTTGNLATAVNAYLSGQSGEVDVPIRFYLAPFATLDLTGFSATPVGQPDAAVGSGDITFSPTSPVETDPVVVGATLHNAGALDSGPMTAAFYATRDTRPEYIGSAYVPNVPRNNGTAAAQIPWDTSGFTGAVPVRVVLDPYNRVDESDEGNNVVTSTITISTRPDLSVPAIALSDVEPTAGEAVTVTLTLSNTGQTAAGASTLALYDGSPTAGGALVCQSAVSVPGGSQTTPACAWTPATAGLHRLFAQADRDAQVNESDENNNHTIRDVYVGLASPRLIDSGGGDAYDPAYSISLGFGYLDGESNTFCGTAANGSQRSDYDGQVQYRFDHLLPGHFYHLDLTLYECDGLGRQEQVRIDDNPISDVIDLSDLAPHRLSFRLDPAFYADRSIVVSIEELLGNDAIVSEINLYDIDYRYADAGGSTETDYSTALTFGPLDGVKQSTWGTLPYKSRRIDLGDSNPNDDPDNELRYRFDGLRASKRYQLLITVYQGSGTATVQQTVAVDSVDTGVTLEVTGVDRDDKIVDVPVGMYSGDGTITVRITRLGAAAGAFVNEIALEELTLLPELVTQVTQSMDVHTGGPNWFSFNVKPPVRPAAACTGVTATSRFTSLYGDALLGDAAVPVGTIVEAYTPSGVKTGCFKIAAEGLYGYMRVYGAEGTTAGMAPGDPIFFKINGIAATPTPYPVIWQNDKGTHEIDLAAPDVIPVETLLAPIASQVTRLQCESGTYLPPPADPRFNTCTTVAPGQSYLLWVNTATALTITGNRVAMDEPIALHAGYNWLGYLPICELTVATALAEINGKYDILHSEAGTYRPPPANPAYNNFNTMAPGLGYMIHMTQAATLTYPADLCGTAMNVSKPEAGPALVCPATPTGRFTHFYGQIDAAAGAPIIVYSPRDDVVGCGRVGEGGLLPYLRVYGAEGAAPGMREGETVRLTVDGRPLDVRSVWRDDWDVHLLGEGAVPNHVYLPIIVQ